MRVFYDVDTQNDFMNKEGALYVPGAEGIKPNLEKLTKYARENRIAVVGSVDKHFGTEEYKSRESELQRWGGPFPNHCMSGAYGQYKIPETIVQWGKGAMYGEEEAGYIDNPIICDITIEDILNSHEMQIEVRARTPPYSSKDIKAEILNQEEIAMQAVNAFIREYKTGVRDHFIRTSILPLMQVGYGIYLEKQGYDVFTNPNTEELLKRAGVKEAVVYGVATDYCVKAAVLGMQKRGIQCYVVEDAIAGIAPETTRTALDEMVAAGAKRVKTDEVIKNGL